MKSVILTKGLPGSGKSTWAKQQVTQNPGKFKRVNKDDLRAMLDTGKWSKANERFVESVRDHVILSAIDAGYSVIVDDTNFAPRHEAHIRELVAGRAEVSIKFFDVPLDECIKRDLARPHSVGEKVIRDMYDAFLAPQPEPPEHDPELSNAIIADLDGTLALIGDRSPYDASRCEEDALCVPVADIVRLMSWKTSGSGRLIILMSSRQDIHRRQTEAWLAQHHIPYDALFMRAAGDQRRDSIVKRELFEAHVRGKFNIDFVLDDRDQVVQMWRRELGLKCFQVAEGNF